MNNKTLVKIIEEDARLVINNLKTKPAAGSVVLITGASGLVGTYFLAVLSQIRKLEPVKFRVIAVIQSPPSKVLKSFINKGDKIIKCDLTNYKSLKSLPKADLIIHAAGYAQPGKFLKNPLKTILLNTVATSELIKKLKRDGRFLFISSSEIYSGLKNPPFTEEMIGTTNPQHFRSSYIEGKRCGEAICMALASKNNHIVIGRLSLAYGPGTKRGDQRVLNNFIEQAITKKRIDLMDAGNAKRTYCYVTDAVEMLLNIAISGKNSVYNIGGKSHVTIKELADIIGVYTKASISLPKHSKKLQGAPDEVYLSMKRYEKEFGKKKYVSFKNGLGKTIRWQMELPKNI